MRVVLFWAHLAVSCVSYYSHCNDFSPGFQLHSTLNLAFSP